MNQLISKSLNSNIEGCILKIWLPLALRYSLVNQYMKAYKIIPLLSPSVKLIYKIGILICLQQQTISDSRHSNHSGNLLKIRVLIHRISKDNNCQTISVLRHHTVLRDLPGHPHPFFSPYFRSSKSLDIPTQFLYFEIVFEVTNTFKWTLTLWRRIVGMCLETSKDNNH